MSHVVEYFIEFKDKFSQNLSRLNTSIQKSNDHFKKLESTVSGAGKASAGFDKVKSSIDKLPHSIEDLRNKLRDLNAQFETTHSTKSFQNLRTEIKKTEKELASMTKTAEMSNGGMGSMLKSGLKYFGAAYLASKAFSFAKDSIAEYDQEAKNKAQLRAGLISTKGISGKTTEGMVRQAEDLEGKTLFKHDITEQSQSILLAFNKVRGKIFDETIVSAQNMATRLKMDLPEATRAIGRALQDPIHGMRLLRTAGINFTDDQIKGIKKLIKEGDLYKVQLAILKGLQTNFGGSAEAAAKSGIGPIQQLTNKWYALTEVVGQRFAGSLNKLAPMLGGIVEKFKKWIEIPASENLEEERIHVNALVNQLFDQNINAERRNQLYEELKTIQPDILDGIDKEKINYDLLRQNLAGYNAELKKSISLEFQKETLAPYAKKLYKATEKVAKAETQGYGLFEEAATAIGGTQGEIIREMSQQSVDFQTKLNNIADIVEKERIKAQNSKDPNELKKAGKLSNIEQTWSNYRSNTKSSYGIYKADLGEKEKAQKEYNKALADSDATLKNMGINWDYAPKSKKLGKKGGDKLSLDTEGVDGLGSQIEGIAGGGSKATNITINLKDLINEFKVYSSSVKEGAEEIRAIVTEVLLKVLNSANRIATQ